MDPLVQVSLLGLLFGALAFLAYWVVSRMPRR